MGSGSEITSTNDDASYAKANRKQLLADTGTAIEAAGKVGAGQQAYSESTTAGKKSDVYYNVDIFTSYWQPLIGNLFYKTNWGIHLPVNGTHTNNVQGTFVDTTKTGTESLTSFDTTHGRGINWATGASAGNQAGFRGNNLNTARKFCPLVRFKFKTSETTNIRMFIGLIGSTSIVGNTDDPLNATNGFGIGVTTASANYRILHNDSAGATVSDDSTVVIDTSPHTLDIYADDNASKFWWNLDNNVNGGVTVDIPGQTASLTFQATYTTTTALSRSMNLYQGVFVDIPR